MLAPTVASKPKLASANASDRQTNRRPNDVTAESFLRTFLCC